VPDLAVMWREGGHLLSPGDDLLHFEVVDINRVILKSAADSLLYQAIQELRGDPPNWQVLPLSCFAITGDWTPARLAEGTRFRAYRTVHASTLYDAGYEVWPTATFTDDIADPRNEVHYDVIVAAGPDLVPVDELRSPSKNVRQLARARLRPMFERTLGLLGDVQELEDPPSGLTMDEW
jgi:hypothetical protein